MKDATCRPSGLLAISMLFATNFSHKLYLNWNVVCFHCTTTTVNGLKEGILLVNSERLKLAGAASNYATS